MKELSDVLHNRRKGTVVSSFGEVERKKGEPSSPSVEGKKEVRDPGETGRDAAAAAASHAAVLFLERLQQRQQGES